MAYTKCKDCTDDSEFKMFGPKFCKVIPWNEIPEDNPLRDIPDHAVRVRR